MENEMEVDVHHRDESAVTQVFQASHIMLKILKYCAEDYRKKLFVVGNRSRQGDLKGFLSMRLVNSYFNQLVSMAVKREFKVIKVDTDRYYIRCNDFTIGTHRKPQQNEQRRREEDVEDEDDDDDDELPLPRERLDSESSRSSASSGSISASESEEEMAVDRDLDEELPPRPAQVQIPDDVIDVEYIQRFFKWLEHTFDPLVEQVTSFDSWSFKPCSLPPSWIERTLVVYNSMHPDMEHCSCEQCMRTVCKCRRFFGPLSFKMAKESLIGRSVSYGFLTCTDSFIADVAIEYSQIVGGVHRFDTDLFLEHFGKIRCNNLKVAVQTVPQYADENPRSQPLEIIQLLVQTWEIRSIQFDIVEFMDNEFYNSRCVWATYGIFTEVFFVTYRQESFSDFHHVVPFKTAGTIDKDSREELLPIFYLRQDSDPPRVASTLSIASAVSNNLDSVEYAMQGKIAFHMFRANRFLFVDIGHMDFYGILQTTNWLKYTIRQIMRVLWGIRDQPVAAHGKTVFWIHYVTSLESFMRKIWNEHMEDLLKVNFPDLKITMHTEEAFTKCDNSTIATYDDEGVRPDVERYQLESFYVTFYDARRNNTTNVKIVRLDH